MAHLLASSALAATPAVAAPQRARRAWHCLSHRATSCAPRPKNPTSSLHLLASATSGSSSAGPGESSSSSGGTGNDSLWPEQILFFESGNAISLTSRRRRHELWPEHDFGREQAVQEQLQALQHNNTPYVDHGVEVMYRFADFDPFNPRTMYFGRRMDLGQFERFRRIMHTPPYATLLGHASSQVLSTLEVSEHVWVARVEVTGPPHGDLGSDVAVYEFTMVQRVGGVHDGYWFTQSLIADGNDWQFMRGPPPSQAV